MNRFLCCGHPLSIRDGNSKHARRSEARQRPLNPVEHIEKRKSHVLLFSEGLDQISVFLFFGDTVTI
jgi:hypothetical protein